MLLKDVRQGEVYLVVPYGRAERMPRRPSEYAQHHEVAGMSKWFETVGERGSPYRALEVAVPVQGYDRNGVVLEMVDRDKLEPVLDPDGEPYRREVLATSVMMPFAEFKRLHEEWLDEADEREEARRVEREREQQRSQERAAASWRQQVFASARADILQVCEVLGYVLSPDLLDDRVRLLVELREPDGNPYENGSRQAH